MSVTPDDLLLKAKTLAEGETETDWRLAINRAYYAAYHMARAIAPLRPPVSIRKVRALVRRQSLQPSLSL